MQKSTPARVQIYSPPHTPPSVNHVRFAVTTKRKASPSSVPEDEDAPDRAKKLKLALKMNGKSPSQMPTAMMFPPKTPLVHATTKLESMDKILRDGCEQSRHEDIKVAQPDEPLPDHWNAYTKTSFYNHIQAVLHSPTPSSPRTSNHSPPTPPSSKSPTDPQNSNDFLQGVALLAFESYSNWKEYLKYVANLNEQIQERSDVKGQWKNELAEMSSKEKDKGEKVESLKDVLDRKERGRKAVQMNLNALAEKSVLSERQYENYRLISMSVHAKHEEYHAAAKDELCYLAEMHGQKECLKDKIDTADIDRTALIEIKDKHEDFVERIQEAVESIRGLWEKCVDDEFCAKVFSDVPGG